jgi:single-stranded DNA-binding protein
MSTDKTGFTFDGKGTLLRVEHFTTKTGKDIVTLIFEVEGKWPQFVPVKVFGRMAEQASSWKPGTVLSVSGRLGGRDWQGKVYGDNVAEVVEVVGEQPGAKDSPPPADEDPGLPF